MKKLLISFLLGLTVFFSFAPYLSPIKAQTWYSQDPVEWYLKVYDQSTSPPNEIFGERYTAAQVQWVVYGFLSLPIRMVASVIGDDIITCFMKGFGTGTLDVTTCGGAIVDLTVTIKAFADKIMGVVLPYLTDSTTGPVMASNNRPLIALVFDSTGRTISGIEYSKNLIKRFSPVTEVKAQGVGYSGLTWLQTYWSGFRNISYALLVLVIIVFAFMIMFRVKLSPQTVISVQSALPKIIVAMILITFSYAIAGFAIDLMYVISGLFALLLNTAGFATGNNAWLMISGTGAGYSIAGGFWVFFVMLGYAVMFLVAGIWSFITTLAGGLSIFGAVVSIIFIIMTVWVLVLMIIYTIKIPYVLLKTLISFYISVITGPIQILAGTIVPSMGFGIWFKKLMADILVFPVTGLLFWFMWSTLWTSYHQAGLDIARGLWLPSADMWAPGIIGSAHDMSGLIFLAISFGIMTLIPKVPGLLKQFIMGEKFTGGSDIGGAAAIATVGAGLGTTYAQGRSEKYAAAATATGLTPAQQAALTKKSTTWGKVVTGGKYVSEGLKHVR